jgi:hypothetical protein
MKVSKHLERQEFGETAISDLPAAGGHWCETARSFSLGHEWSGENSGLCRPSVLHSPPAILSNLEGPGYLHLKTLCASSPVRIFSPCYQPSGLFHSPSKYGQIANWLGAAGFSPVILVTQEAEIRRIAVLKPAPANNLWDSISKKTLHKKGLVEWLKI